MDILFTFSLLFQILRERNKLLSIDDRRYVIQLSAEARMKLKLLQNEIRHLMEIMRRDEKKLKQSNHSGSSGSAAQQVSHLECQ